MEVNDKKSRGEKNLGSRLISFNTKDERLNLSRLKLAPTFETTDAKSVLVPLSS